VNQRDKYLSMYLVPKLLSGHTFNQNLFTIFGVALTGRNRTGPPWSVGRPVRPRADHPRSRWPGGPPAGSTTDDRRRQRPATVTSLAPYTMCRRASN